MKKDKVNLILDLDNTLISAIPTEEFNFKKEKKKATKFVFHNMDDYYIVFERPHVQEFLTYAFDNFNVSVWTAATKDYAIFIIDNVILKNHPERNIDYVFYSYHCDLSMDEFDNTKDLRMLWDKYNLPGYSNKNTFIMDDYIDVKQHNHNNCIMVQPFEYIDINSNKDNYLKSMNKLMKNKPLTPGKNFLSASGYIEK